MSSKLRIRIGEVEIDYEGTEEFLKLEVPQLLKTAMELHKAFGGDPRGGGDPTSRGTAAEPVRPISLTTGSIAAKLNAKSGSDLLTAAAAHLAIVKGTMPFTRQQLLEEMQSATAYYKKNYSANLTKYIKKALQKDGPLSETSKNSYALKAAARKELEQKLAND